MLKPAVVLATHTMGLGVIRALGTMGVPIVAVHYDAKDMGYCSRYVTEQVRAPHPKKDEAEFVSLLVDLAHRLSGSPLFPVSDETLYAVSKNKGLLERHFLVACTEWAITERFIDKSLTYALADSVGVPAPRTLTPECVEEVEQYGQTVDYPCLVKPSLSHRYFDYFGKKMTKVDSLDQMIAAYQEAASAGLKVMLQEFIPGDDSQTANYNSYLWDGEPLVEFTAQQIRKAPPELGSPCVVLSKHIPELIEPGRKILRAMGFYGYSCTEFKRDARDGVYKLMEVNGRHNLSTLLAVRCGVNFPWLHYQHLVDNTLPPTTDYQDGIYWLDIDRDVAYSANPFSRQSWQFGQFIRPYLSPHVFAVLDWRDPKPFAKRGIHLVQRTFNAAVYHKHQE